MTCLILFTDIYISWYMIRFIIPVSNRTDFLPSREVKFQFHIHIIVHQEVGIHMQLWSTFGKELCINS